MNKSVIILVYSLAPKNGVGARRWQKFALELANQNNNVFVVGADNLYNEYIDHKNIKYYTFSSKYPKILDCSPKTIIQKLRYHAAVKYQKFKAKGATYDRASLDKEIVLNVVEAVMEEYKVKNLIVSGAPFSLLYYGALLKEKYPFVNLISDIRDAWTWGEGYGMQLLSVSKKEYEEHQEEIVITNSNFVTVASDDLKIKLLKKYNKFQNKISTLLNGIELEHSYKSPRFESEKVVIIHIGTVNIGVEKYWKPFLDIIKNLDQEVVLLFIGGNNIDVTNYVKSNNITNVSFVNRIPEQELQGYFEKSHFVLMFKKDGFENTFPTKYFDYIKFERPIIAFTQKGTVAKEIVDNKLGAVFNEQINVGNIKDFINQYKSKPFNKDYDKFKFSIKGLTSEVIKKLV